MQLSLARGPATLHSIFERALHEQRRPLAVWSASLALLALAMTGLYPTVRGNPELANLHEAYPKALRSMFGITDLASGTGYLRAELFSLVAPLLVIVLAVLWGGDMIAGEEERGTIDILMANPVSRARVVLEKWAALVAGVGIAGLALGLGLAIGVPATGMEVSPSGLSAAILASVLLGLVFGSLALAIGAASGRRGLARGTAAAAAVLSYLVSSLADVIGWLRPIRPLSPWYHALGVDPLRNGFSPAHLAVLLAILGLLAPLAVVFFRHRDLGT